MDIISYHQQSLADTIKILILDNFKNKTKYFRLRLSDEVSTERPETVLRLT